MSRSSQDHRGDFGLVRLVGDDAMYLARGRFGGRPLYYATHPRTGAVLLCSELGPLVNELGSVSVNLDRVAAAAVRSTHKDAGLTHYREVRRVPSACGLRIGPNCWGSPEQVPFQVAPTRSGRLEDLAEELRENIRRAVKRAVSGVDHWGVLVSGGVDSSALLAVALSLAREEGKRVEAFCLSVASAEDDRPHLRALCSALDIVPTLVTPSECGALSQKAWVLDDAPAGWMGIAWEFAFARIARERGATLLLSGVGGDEVFNGDLRLFGHLASHGHLTRAVRSAARLKGYGASTPRSRVETFVLRPLVRSMLTPRFVQAVRRARRRPYAWAGPRLRRILSAGILDHYSASFWPPGAPTARSVLATLASSAGYADVSDGRGQLEATDDCGRADPFLDDDLVEFVASLRPDLLFDGDWVRGLFRRALHGWIPDSIRWRRDKGSFEEAYRAIVQAWGGFGTVEPLAGVTRLADVGLVEPRAFRKRFDELARAPLNGPLWLEVWPVLAQEAFLRTTT